MATRTPFPTLLVVIPLLLGACGTDATGPVSVVGQYTAVTFQTVQSTDTSDLLAGGSSLTITLMADSTTTGQLYVPAALNNGTPLNASMEGTYTLANGVVTFSQAADTFVRDMAFTVSGKTLLGNQDFGGTTIIVVLTRP